MFDSNLFRIIISENRWLYESAKVKEKKQEQQLCNRSYNGKKAYNNCKSEVCSIIAQIPTLLTCPCCLLMPFYNARNSYVYMCNNLFIYTLKWCCCKDYLTQILRRMYISAYGFIWCSRNKSILTPFINSRPVASSNHRIPSFTWDIIVENVSKCPQL